MLKRPLIQPLILKKSRTADKVPFVRGFLVALCPVFYHRVLALSSVFQNFFEKKFFAVSTIYYSKALCYEKVTKTALHGAFFLCGHFWLKAVDKKNGIKYNENP